MWSGGLDSTYVLDDLLRKKKEGKIAEDVIAFSIDHDQVNVLQRRAEKKARKAFIKWASKEYFRFRSETVTIRGGCVNNNGCGQAATWLSLMPYLTRWFNKLDSTKNLVHFAYLRGDDFWHHERDFRDVFYNSMRILGYEYPKSNMQYDLQSRNKWELIAWERRIKRKAPGSIWYCESPTGRLQPCNKCNCCIRHRMAQTEYRLRRRLGIAK